MDTYNKTTSYQDTYFRSPHMVVIVLVPILLALLTATYLIPNQMPFDSMGPIGTAAIIMVNYLPAVLKAMFYIAWSAHLIQPFFAVILCRQKGIHPNTTIWWAAQTFMYGLFSLKYLIHYQPKKQN